MKKKILTLILTVTILTVGLSQNNSLDFDGTDDYVNIGNAVGNNLRTVECWFNLDNPVNSSISDFIAIVVRNGSPMPWGFGLSFNRVSPNAGKLRFYIQDFSGNATDIHSNSNSWNSNQWYHVAGVLDPVNGMRLYIDGVLQTDTDSYSNHTGTNNSQFTAIGAWGGFTGSRYFEGKIDEVRLWSVARTPSEISSNMNTELTGTESNLVSYYKMDITDSSCDVEDCNSNENHGIRNGSSGSNNLPQYSTDVPSLTDIACGATNSCTSQSAIPTLSEWGLFILALLLLNISTIVMTKPSLAFAGTSKITFISFNQLPFDKLLFIKRLIPISIMVFVVFCIAVGVFNYQLTNADLPGSMIAVPLLAYLFHLLGEAKS